MARLNADLSKAQAEATNARNAADSSRKALDDIDAITALETLHGQGRKIGVITHVAAMIESIPVQSDKPPLWLFHTSPYGAKVHA